jgi:23S rRNA maturation-related 3'-5' exoribonuclease YhaM
MVILDLTVLENTTLKNSTENITNKQIIKIDGIRELYSDILQVTIFWIDLTKRIARNGFISITAGQRLGSY